MLKPEESTAKYFHAGQRQTALPNQVTQYGSESVIFKVIKDRIVMREPGDQSAIVRLAEIADNVDTTAALDFHNQLTSTQLLLALETGDASFRVRQMREFLEKNY